MTEAQTLIHSLTLDQLSDHLQKFGYRAERVKDPAGQILLRSATAGMGFDLRMGSKLPGNQLPGETQAQAPVEAHTDFTFLVVFAINGGTLPPDLLNSWNNAYRFARLRTDQRLLILDMDVSVAGGVSRNHLRAAFATWDQLIASLIPYLRTELTRNELARQNGSAKITAKIVPEPAQARASANAPAAAAVIASETAAPKAPDPLAALANSEPAATPSAAAPAAAKPATTFRAPPRTSPLQATAKAPDTRTEAAKAIAQALHITSADA